VAGHGRSNADALLIVALAQGKTGAEAAEAAGVSERTVYRRLEAHEFRLEVARAQQAIVAPALGALAEGMVEAASTLRRLSTEGPPPVQLKAALALLDLYPKLIEDHLRQGENMEEELSRIRRKRER
jgi:hypothetical protein